MNTHIRIAAWAAAAAAMGAAPACGAAAPGTQSCKSVKTAPASLIMLGKASVIPLAAPVARIMASTLGAAKPARHAASPAAPAAGAAPAASPSGSAGQDGVADVDVVLLSPTDLFVRGDRAGTTNIILQDASGVCYLRDIVVSIDATALQAKLAELLPDERGIAVGSAENSLILSGTVSDAANLDEALRVATAYGDGKRVVNLMRVTAPQQVMLEV